MNPRDPQQPPPKNFIFNWPKKIIILIWVASRTSTSAQNERSHKIEISIRSHIIVANRMNCSRQVRKTLLFIAKSSRSKRFRLLSSCNWRSSLKMRTITTIPQNMRNILRSYLDNIGFALEQNKIKRFVNFDHTNVDSDLFVHFFFRTVNCQCIAKLELKMSAMPKCNEKTRMNANCSRFSHMIVQKEHPLDERLRRWSRIWRH